MEMILLAVSFFFPVPPFLESILPLLFFFFFSSKDYLFERVLVKKKMESSAWGLTGKVSYRRQLFIVGTDLSGDW